MSTLFPKQTGIDSKRCWELWWKEGLSLEKSAIKLEGEGVISPYTKKRFTPTAIRYGAWKWALQAENQKEAYEDVRKTLAEKQGRIISEDEWKRIMVENARFVWYQTPQKVDQFIKQFHLEEYANAPA